jgi:hypothetical protein
LQNLFFYSLIAADLPPDTIRSAVQTLIVGAGPQHIELRTNQWTARLFREVAEGIAGQQWSAYLQILWCNTPLAFRAQSVGMNAGIAAHTSKDIRSNDPRYTTLSDRDKGDIVAWARLSVDALRAEQLNWIDALLPGIERVFAEVQR